MSRALGGPMKREGYSPAFIAAIIASAHHTTRGAGAAEHHRRGLRRGRQRLDRGTVHGGRGARIDDRLRPDDLLLFLRPVRHMRKPRAPLRQIVFAAGDAALPLMIPVNPAQAASSPAISRRRKPASSRDIWIIAGGDPPSLNRGHLRKSPTTSAWPG